MRETRAGDVGIGTAPATFGELLQGELDDPRVAFLVTLPVQRWATAFFSPDDEMDEVVVRPTHKTKARRLAEQIVAGSDFVGGGVLELAGGIPEGKGLASSSADLVATARAVSSTLGQDLSQRDIEDYLRAIEPTDGVMYDGIVAFYHREVRLRARFGHLPQATLVGYDLGGEVDTVLFNRLARPKSASARLEYQDLLGRLAEAVGRGDVADVGRISTRSAELSEHAKHLGPAEALAAALGGAGVVVAHSGTMVGALIGGRHEEGVVETACEILRCEPEQVSVFHTLGSRQDETGDKPAAVEVG